MAKKSKKVELKPALTKRQLAKWQRQQRWQHITIAIGGLFLVFILSYVSYGYYTNEIAPLRQPITKVNDTVFTMDYYLEALRFYSRGQQPSVVSFLAHRIVGIIQDNELIKQGAEKLGIMIKEEEIDRELKRFKLTNNQAVRDIIRGQLLREKLMKEYFSAKIPPVGEQVKIQAIFLESKKTAAEVIAKIEEGEDFVFLAKEFSQETQTRTKGGDLGWLPKGLAKILFGSSLLEEIAFSLEPGKLSQPVYDAEVTKNSGYWLIKMLDKKDKENVHIKVMLLGTEEEAEKIKAKLEAGEDFDNLAKELSQHLESKDKGGDLGWKTKEELETIGIRFSKVTLALEKGQVSEPVRDGSVQTKGGYWLIKVLDKDQNRQIEADALEKLKNQAFNDWFSELKDNSKLENYVDEKKRSWAIARISKGG